MNNQRHDHYHRRNTIFVTKQGRLKKKGREEKGQKQMIDKRNTGKASAEEEKAENQVSPEDVSCDEETDDKNMRTSIIKCNNYIFSGLTSSPMDPLRRGSKFALNFCYLGSRYSGVQRQCHRTKENIDKNYDNSIQMAIDIGLRRLTPAPVNEYLTGLSSRTDKDVHALDNYLFTQILHPGFPSEDYTAKQVKETVSEYLKSKNHEIQIKKCIHLPQDFRIFRSAEYREYVYRFLLPEGEDDFKFYKQLPESIRKQLSLIFPRKGRGDVDIDTFNRAIKMFIGKHNFRSFEKHSNSLRHGFVRERDPVKDLTVFDINPITVQSIMNGVPEEYVTDEMRYIFEEKQLYEITVRSTSFMYRQIRMMVGMAFMASWGEASLERIQFMLDFPFRWNWRNNDFMAPPQGLFLSKVKLKQLND